MILRSGFKYNFNTLYVKRKVSLKSKNNISNINHDSNKTNDINDDTLRCSICFIDFEKNDVICICDTNYNNHSFHKSCILEYINYSQSPYVCPYCLTEMNFKYKKV